MRSLNLAISNLAVSNITRLSLEIVMAACLLLISCRPRPEEGESSLFHATAPDEQGLSTLTSRPGVLEAGSLVTLTNSNLDETYYANANEDGSLLHALAAESGDLIGIAYMDEEGLPKAVSLVVPLASISIHGLLLPPRPDTNSCLTFQRDDLIGADLEAETSSYELVGPVADELVELSRGQELPPMTILGTPILFGLGECGLPLFEPETYLTDDEAPPISLHGRLLRKDGDGETCPSIGVTAELPIPPGTMGPEDETNFDILPMGEVADELLSKVDPSAWLVVSGRFLESSDEEDFPCGLRPFQLHGYWVDSGVGMELEGMLSQQEDLTTDREYCWRFEQSSSSELEPLLSLVGPLIDNLKPFESEPTPLRITGYPTLGIPDDSCGARFTLAGYERLDEASSRESSPTQREAPTDKIPLPRSRP